MLSVLLLSESLEPPAHASMLRSTSAFLLTRLATTTIRAMAAIDSSGCAGECYADGTYQRGARLRLALCGMARA